jgi:hypothetical protein
MNTENNQAIAAPFNVPVVLFFFNRPKELKAVFEAIAKIKPSTLFLIADGPREENIDDPHLCSEARSIVNRVDWPCKVYRQYSETNQGCRNAIPNGLDWVFSHVEKCIILEDDCVPSDSFFYYCEDLLNLYCNNPSIMTIGGHRYDGPDEFDGQSYFFSKYPSTWGWATWRRAWEHFDLELTQWPKLKNTDWLPTILGNKHHELYWSRIFDQMFEGMDAWDYALVFSCWVQNGISIRSKVNLIENIGFGPNATHTKDNHQLISQRKRQNPPLPLQHPGVIQTKAEDEDRIEWVSYSGTIDRMLQSAHQKIRERQKPKN